MPRGRPRKKPMTSQEAIERAAEMGEQPQVRRARARLVIPAKGGEPVDESTHTRWVYDKPRRIRDAERDGYVRATEEDVVGDHKGYMTSEGVIRDGDLVLMKCNRERVEIKERARLQEMENQQRIVRGDQDQGLITLEEHHQERRGKFISIP